MRDKHDEGIKEMRSTGISFGTSKLLKWCSYFTLKPELESTVIAPLAGRNAQEGLYTEFLQTPSGDSYDAYGAVVSKTKTEARSTQNSKTKHPTSKTKHPKLENEDP